jgi:hypothetical protein
MEVSCQPCASATLPQGKEPQISIEYGAGWPVERVWTCLRRKVLCPRRQSNRYSLNAQPFKWEDECAVICNLPLIALSRYLWDFVGVGKFSDKFRLILETGRLVGR